MFKAIVLLERRADLGREEFRDWWLGRHAALARELPGLRRAVFNVVEGDEGGFDGVSELWFDSRDAFDAAYASEQGRRVVEDSLAHVSRRERLFVDERVVRDGPTGDAG